MLTNTRLETLLAQAQEKLSKERDGIVAMRTRLEQQITAMAESLDKLPADLLACVVMPETVSAAHFFPSLYSQRPTQEDYDRERAAFEAWRAPLVQTYQTMSEKAVRDLEAYLNDTPG